MLVLNRSILSKSKILIKLAIFVLCAFYSRKLPKTLNSIEKSMRYVRKLKWHSLLKRTDADTVNTVNSEVKKICTMQNRTIEIVIEISTKQGLTVLGT